MGVAVRAAGVGVGAGAGRAVGGPCSPASLVRAIGRHHPVRAGDCSRGVARAMPGSGPGMTTDRRRSVGAARAILPFSFCLPFSPWGEGARTEGPRQRRADEGDAVSYLPSTIALRPLWTGRRAVAPGGAGQPISQTLPTHGKRALPPAGRAGGAGLLRSLTDVAVRPALVWRYASTPRPRGTAVRKPGTRGREGCGARARSRRLEAGPGGTRDAASARPAQRPGRPTRRATATGFGLKAGRPSWMAPLEVSSRDAAAGRSAARRGPGSTAAISRRVGSGRRAVARHTRRPARARGRRPLPRLTRGEPAYRSPSRGARALAGRFGLSG